ncbi:hypothetical protein [Comamonas sp. JUb58]|uniref:hypothetical protein n=1 Tax=Comamonas sp. JUb58 TaxID=2485114 RepID=UPI00105D540C|nr:hypothetical protein [Comamonas sp. JUb58]
MIFCTSLKFRIFFYINAMHPEKQNIFCQPSRHTFCIETLLPKPLSGRACLPAAPLSTSPQAVSAAMGAVALRRSVCAGYVTKLLHLRIRFPVRPAPAPWHSGALEQRQQTALYALKGLEISAYDRSINSYV